MIILALFVYLSLRFCCALTYWLILNKFAESDAKAEEVEEQQQEQQPAPPPAPTVKEEDKQQAIGI